MRFKLTLLKRGTNFTQEVIDHVQKISFNHNKVIRWVDGCPQYSVYSPPILGKAHAYQEAKKAIDAMQGRHHPTMFNIAITELCNNDCYYCSFKAQSKDKDVMNTGNIIHTIHEAQDLGVSTILITGGEPLLNNDVGKIIQSIDKSRSISLMFTNGWFLKDKIGMLKKSGLDSVAVSINYADAENHDKSKKKAGTFDRAISGIKASLNEGLTVAIACCLDRKAVESNELKKIMKLAKKLGVHEVIVFNYVPYQEKKDGCIKDLNNTGWLDQHIKMTEYYNNIEGFPAIHAYTHLNSHKGLGCSGGTIFLYVTPYGDLHPCDFNPYTIGNVLESPLHVLWDKLIEVEHFKKSSFNGCKMKDKAYREFLKKEGLLDPVKNIKQPEDKKEKKISHKGTKTQSKKEKSIKKDTKKK